MKDKILQIRVDAEFLSKLEYLRHINGFKSIAETVRKVVEKEHRKESQQDDVMTKDEMLKLLQEHFGEVIRKMSTEELIQKFKEDISWLEQGCATEREIVEHIKEAIRKLERTQHLD